MSTRQASLVHLVRTRFWIVRDRAREAAASAFNDLATRLGHFDERDLQKPHGRRHAHISEARFYGVQSYDPANDWDGSFDPEITSQPKAETDPSPVNTAPPGGATYPVPDPPPHCQSSSFADAISFAADLLAVFGAGGLIVWGRYIAGWLKRNNGSTNAGGALPVALWHLSQAYPNAAINRDHYDVLDPVVDSRFASAYVAVYVFRFFDRSNGHVYVLEIDSSGELRSIAQRALGPFE